ncbi:putative secreted protein (Por secretion system target) [Breznakibacter xylanolyticus]|uniref:Putative secreted protein (Por secretion system target) n=1 Tax=Breznakibacter xylanolyticus TaxID=990 RepID=A0A2W7NDF0_9BACT|nr:Ig-like domain-containing protein [Breznakibacter xylanolyticus]PZX16167.1 putative secreted protein (Por secretion system target) [Breznakibacter xylanolyticus]
MGKLYWLSQNSWAWSAYFIQTTDIDATCTKDWNSGLGFSPIGNSTITNFNGHYNGKGHTIKGLYINRSATVSVGLFGDCNKATIDSLCVTDAFIKGNKFVGSIVGRSNLSTLKCCRASNAVSGSWYIGGLVGYASGSSNISNCYSTSDVSGANYVGGLVGSNNYYSQISNCYSTGNVSGTDYVGGLAGINDYSTKISNCYFTGSVKGNSCVGGMVGYNISTSNIENGYFAGTVSGKTNLVGATAGVNSANSTISNVYWNWQVSKTSDCGEDKGTTINITRLSTEQIKKPANLNNLGSFETVWAIREDSTYAVLQDISNNAPFAFNDNIGVTGRTSLLTVLNNDYDYETLQSKLAIKFTQLPNTGSITNKYYYSFPTGTPAGSQNSFQYRVGEVLAPGDTLWGNTATVVLTKVANTAPSALNDAAIITEDSGTTTIDALANDSDADKDLISISGIASGYPLHGTATISNGKIDYTPAADYHGTDTIAYIISDGDLTNTANVIVTITPVNDTPVLTAVTDKSINKGENITLTMDDVVATDVDGDDLSLVIAPGENYTVSGNTITPASGFTGTLSVGISVTDGELTSNVMVMSIEVASATGMGANAHDAMQLSPNPATDQVTLHATAPVSRVQFVNAAGQTVLTHDAPTGSMAIGALKPGVYLVKVISTNGQVDVLRLVKQ